jgi:hypothetical protein
MTLIDLNSYGFEPYSFHFFTARSSSNYGLRSLVRASSPGVKMDGNREARGLLEGYWGATRELLGRYWGATRELLGG